MRLYCISDMHGNLDGFDPAGCDICVIAGDFSKMTGFGKWHLYDQKKWIEKRFIQLSRTYPDIQFVVIPGNHDLCLDPKLTSCYTDLNWNIAWPENVHLLIDSVIEINGKKIYGTPWIPVISYRWAFEAEHDILSKMFDKIPSGLDILVTHSPPHIPDANVDFSLQTGSGPFGSTELTQCIMTALPKLVICGHIHTGSHTPVFFGESVIRNVSRLDESYKIAYEPTVIEF